MMNASAVLDIKEGKEMNIKGVVVVTDHSD